jgi:hypothetical protein
MRYCIVRRYSPSGIYPQFLIQLRWLFTIYLGSSSHDYYYLRDYFSFDFIHDKGMPRLGAWGNHVIPLSCDQPPFFSSQSHPLPTIPVTPPLAVKSQVPKASTAVAFAAGASVTFCSAMLKQGWTSEQLTEAVWFFVASV